MVIKTIKQLMIFISSFYGLIRGRRAKTVNLLKLSDNDYWREGGVILRQEPCTNAYNRMDLTKDIHETNYLVVLVTD